jgi:uncharacterized protein YhhL (DUF1145 family)
MTLLNKLFIAFVFLVIVVSIVRAPQPRTLKILCLVMAAIMCGFMLFR